MVDEADARVKAFEKSMEISKLSYEFTRVVSPIDGQISRYYLTLGNLVNQDQTLLTTVVSVDPMYVYFEMDEPTLLRTRKAVNEGKIKRPTRAKRSPSPWDWRGRMGSLTQGTINFVNNQVNPAHRQYPGARCLSQPLAQGRPPAAIAGHVRKDPAADRPTPSGPAGRRSRRRVGPGAQIRLCARCGKQGPVSPGHGRCAARRRTARHRARAQAG